MTQFNLELAELRKDKERLDWLLSRSDGVAVITSSEDGIDLNWLTDRTEISNAMKGGE